jgi:hypothetical protein
MKFALHFGNITLILGCPGALPNPGSDPRAAVEERAARAALLCR